MAEHNIHTLQQHRQKPTSQQNRDRKRAEECNRRLKQKLRQTDALKNQQADDFLDSGFELFAQTSEYRAHQHEHRDVHITTRNCCIGSLEADTAVLDVDNVSSIMVQWPVNPHYHYYYYHCKSTVHVSCFVFGSSCWEFTEKNVSTSPGQLYTMNSCNLTCLFIQVNVRTALKTVPSSLPSCDTQR